MIKWLLLAALVVFVWWKMKTAKERAALVADAAGQVRAGAIETTTRVADQLLDAGRSRLDPQALGPGVLNPPPTRTTIADKFGSGASI